MRVPLADIAETVRPSGTFAVRISSRDVVSTSFATPLFTDAMRVQSGFTRPSRKVVFPVSRSTVSRPSALWICASPDAGGGAESTDADGDACVVGGTAVGRPL